MQEPEETSEPIEENRNPIFMSAWPEYNRPGQIVTLGHYYPKERAGAARDVLKERRAGYDAGPPANSEPLRSAPLRPGTMRRNLGWTQLINSLNAERQWPHKRLFELLNPMLEPDIAIAVVPTHMAYQAFWPLRTLARELAAHGRIDATSCLVRHTTIRRITYGGPSSRALHRQTIRIENAHLVASKRVLLLDDIAKSGASLLACRDMLHEAGASLVQAMALGRVIVGEMEAG
jgi:hypothetical protein